GVWIPSTMIALRPISDLGVSFSYCERRDLRFLLSHGRLKRHCWSRLHFLVTTRRPHSCAGQVIQICYIRYARTRRVIKICAMSTLTPVDLGVRGVGQGLRLNKNAASHQIRSAVSGGLRWFHVAISQIAGPRAVL